MGKRAELPRGSDPGQALRPRQLSEWDLDHAPGGAQCRASPRLDPLAPAGAGAQALYLYIPSPSPSLGPGPHQGGVWQKIAAPGGIASNAHLSVAVHGGTSEVLTCVGGWGGGQLFYAALDSPSQL